MILSAGKYSDVRSATGGKPARKGVAPSPDAKARTSDLNPRRPHPQSAPGIFVPRRDVAIDWKEWLHRASKPGGTLDRYIEREKALTARRMRAVARRMHGRRQNARSDLRLLAAVPAREYHRWKAVDPDFWLDDANLRSLRRDNADACVYL